MAYDLPILNAQTQRRLNQQVANLTKEAGHITDMLSKFTSDASRDAGHYAQDLLDDAWHTGEVAAREIGKQAARAGRAVSKDPVPAAIALVGFACLLTLVLATGRNRHH